MAERFLDRRRRAAARDHARPAQWPPRRPWRAPCPHWGWAETIAAAMLDHLRLSNYTIAPGRSRSGRAQFMRPRSKPD